MFDLDFDVNMTICTFPGPAHRSRLNHSKTLGCTTRWGLKVNVCAPFAQALNSLVSTMTTTEDAIPAREPYIVGEAAEGVAYHQLPTPKGAVLLSITATVADLNKKITTVGNAELCCAQVCCTLLQQQWQCCT